MSNGATQSSSPPRESSFEEELAAARAGSSAKVGRLLERYRQYLLAIAAAELPQPLAGKVGASDLVQETLVRGYEHFGKFAGHSPEQLGAWLRQILLNHLTNVARSYQGQKRNLQREEELDSQIAFQEESTASQKLASTEQQDLLARGLNRLPEELRWVLEMRHRENLSFGEIALRLGKSEDTARRLWARAVEQLRRELKSHEP